MTFDFINVIGSGFKDYLIGTFSYTTLNPERGTFNRNQRILLGSKYSSNHKNNCHRVLA